ncbi:MAG: hypothetical protein Q9217_003925 [Psora testacea]
MSSTSPPFGDMEGILKENDYNQSNNGFSAGNQAMIPTELQLPDDTSEVFEPSLLYSNQFAGQSARPPTPAHPSTRSSLSERSSPGPRPPQPLSDTHSSCLSETWLYHTSVLEHHAVVAARESWSYFKCNPSISRSACPRTAGIHLEGLEQTLKSTDVWQRPDLLPKIVKPATDVDNIMVERFHSFTRDKLLAITQMFIHKAMKSNHGNTFVRATPTDTESSGFVVLPPSNVLHYFLVVYVYRFEPHYPSLPAGLLNTNEMMRVGNAQAASLLLLLMVVLGGSATPNKEAQFLSSGFLEASRISLGDLVEHDIEPLENLNLFRYRNGSTVSVHSGTIQPCPLRLVFLAENENRCLNTRACWIFKRRGYQLPNASPALMQLGRSGKHMKQEAGKISDPVAVVSVVTESLIHWYRLVASWVSVDQELSLFMDVAPVLSMSNLMTVMPDMDLLWQAKSSNEWLKAYERTNGASNKPRMTLRDLFRFFLDGGLSKPNVQLLPIQLKLLLHPLQSLTIHLRQFLRCYPEESSGRKGDYAISKSALRSRFEEIQSLLKQWYALVRRCSPERAEDCAVTSANLIIYHLISLNAVICLSEIEQFASSETGSKSPRSSSSLRGNYTEHTEEVFFHCGQVLRLVRLTAESMRPPWWPAAVYRAALASWAVSMASAKSRSLLSSLSREANQPFAIDTLAPEHASVMRYLSSGDGQPMFTKTDGTMISLGEPRHILNHCVEFLGEEPATSFKEGIQSKLARLAGRWQSWKYE